MANAAHDFPRLPHDRPMTPEEQRGFRIALACLSSWGTQITAHSISLPAQILPEKPMHAQERLGRQLVYIAEALDRTIGTRGF